MTDTLWDCWDSDLDGAYGSVRIVLVQIVDVS